MRFKAALVCLLLVVGTAAVAEDAQFQFIARDGTVLTNVVISAVNTNGQLIGRYGSETDGVYNIPAEAGEKVYFNVHQPISGADFDAEGMADTILTVVQVGYTPTPAQVANDFCADAVPIAVPSLTTGSTIGATTDTGYTTPCGAASITSPGVWYTFIGTGTELVASVCENSGGAADYDTKLSVYCLTCDEATSVCVDGNDDESGCNFHSSVAFGAEAGNVYYVMVHGYGGETGAFDLGLIDTGVAYATPTPPACEPPPPQGACCDCAAPPFNCVDTDELSCAAAGGQFLGADTTCVTPAPAIRYESMPGLPIGDVPNDVVSDTITVPDSVLISDINVELDITHTWIGDMDITIEHNGTAVVIFFHQCGSTQNIHSTADDEGTSLYCSSISLGPSNGVFWPPAIAGLGPLSVYDGTDVMGDWTLTIVDTYPSLDDGTLDAWALTLPTGAPTANCPAQNDATCFLCGNGLGDDDDDDDGGGGNVNASDFNADYQNESTNFGL